MAKRHIGPLHEKKRKKKKAKKRKKQACASLCEIPMN